MIELDRSGINTSRAQGGEFRMAGAKILDVAHKFGLGASGPQVGMALRAIGICGFREPPVPSMLLMAGRTIGRKSLAGMMNWPIMAGETSLIASLRAKETRGLDVTCSAFRGEESMRR
ncbi:MAG: hypothetical protein ABSG27_14630 [Candidatus Acidiferrales bacterium]